MEDVVIVKNLKKVYREGQFVNKALDGVSFEVKKGEFVSIIGPDGAGKTTLIKILCGIFDYEYGEVNVLGFNLPLQLDKIKNRIGYLSQKFSLYGNLTVEENLNYFGRIFGVDKYRERMIKLLEVVKLDEFKDRLARNLSGGMKQKLGVICGLIHAPEIFFLDEPTTGVDPVSRREIFKLIEAMIEEGVTVIMSTSYMDEAERAHRVLMLDKGKVIKEGSYEQLLDDCKWQNLVIEIEEPDFINYDIDKLAGVRFLTKRSGALHILVDESFSLDLLKERLKGSAKNIFFEPLSMEDLFIANHIKSSERANDYRSG